MMTDVQLVQHYYEQLLKWGEDHSYHWFWRIIALPQVGRHAVQSRLLPKLSIAASVAIYESDGRIEALRHEVEAYRQRPFLIYWLLRLVNYQSLAHKEILLAYANVSDCMQLIKCQVEAVVNNQRDRSYTWKAVFNNVRIKLNDGGRVLGKQIASLADNIGRLAQKIPSNEHELIIKVSDEVAPLPRSGRVRTLTVDSYVHVTNDRQVIALATLGIVCQIGETYSEKAVRDEWKRLAMVYHPDKGGSVEKFRAIHEARELLKGFVEHGNHRVSARDWGSSERYELDAKERWQETLVAFESAISQVNDYDTLNELFKGVIKAVNTIVVDYEQARKQHFVKRSATSPLLDAAVEQKMLEDDVNALFRQCYSEAIFAKDLRRIAIEIAIFCEEQRPDRVAARLTPIITADVTANVTASFEHQFAAFATSQRQQAAELAQLKRLMQSNQTARAGLFALSPDLPGEAGFDEQASREASPMLAG